MTSSAPLTVESLLIRIWQWYEVCNQVLHLSLRSLHWQSYDSLSLSFFFLLGLTSTQTIYGLLGMGGGQRGGGRGVGVGGGGGGGGGRVPLSSSCKALRPARTGKPSATQKTMDVKVVRTSPVQSNSCTSQLACSTGVGKTVTADAQRTNC